MKKLFFTICLLTMAFSVFALDQIKLGSNTYNIDTLENYKAGPGTQYTALRLKSASGLRMDAFFLKVDLTNPYMNFSVGIGRDSIYLGECPTTYAARKTTDTRIYVGGTNGSFYATSGTDAMGYSTIGLPTQTVMCDGEISLTRKSYNQNLFAITADKQVEIGHNTFSGKAKRLSDGLENSIAHVNYVRNENELVFYNKYNGKITRTNQYGSEALVSLVGNDTWGTNKTVKVKVEQIWKDKGSNAIPAGKAILSGHGTSKTFVEELAVGDELELTFNIAINGQSLDFANMVGGDSYAEIMLRDGVVTNTWNELHPRTCIGYTKDRKTVIQCVVDGRGFSRGATTGELAELMLASGAWTATNLDGGGSSCMFLHGVGQQNRPSDGTERAVANTVSAVATIPAPDNTISEILTYNSVVKLPRYGSYMPKILGYNQYGILINRDVTENIQLSCSPEMGYIAENGNFVASGNAGGTLTITYNGNITTSVRVELISEAEISIRLDSVLISNKRPYSAEVQSIIEKETMDVLPTALTWTSRNTDVCTVENGVINAVENGRTVVVGSLGSFADSLVVVVENVEHSGLIHSDMSDVENWEITAQKNWNATLSSQNIPANWAHGGAVNYVYQTHRAPSLRLENKQRLYSLPDSMKIYLNTGDIKVSKMFVGVRANNEKSTIQKTFSDLPTGTDFEVKVDFSELFDTKDFAIFPIWLDYISNQITASSQKVGNAYSFAIRDITLYYEGVPVGLNTPEINNLLVVYPNPVTNGEARVQLGLSQPEKVTMEIINLQGQILRKANLGTVNNEAVLPLQNLVSGTYFVRLTHETKTDVVKILVK